MEVRIKTDTMTPQMKRMLRKIQNRRPVLREIGSEASSMARRAFTDGTLRPTDWNELTEITKARKAAAGKGSSPLIWSGTMARSPRVSHVDSDDVRISSDRVAGMYSIAAIHQLGAPAGRFRHGLFSLLARMAKPRPSCASAFLKSSPAGAEKWGFRDMQPSMMNITSGIKDLGGIQA